MSTRLAAFWFLFGFCLGAEVMFVLVLEVLRHRERQARAVRYWLVLTDVSIEATIHREIESAKAVAWN